MPLQCQDKVYKSSKFATIYDLDALDWTVMKFRNEKLDNKSNVLLNLFVSIVIKTKKMGFRDHIGCLTTALRRKGFSISDRSIFRALNSLESLGYISRRRYRIGEDRFSATILFSEEAFSFWTKKRTEKTIPFKNTSTYTSPQLPNWQEDLNTNNINTIPDNTNINKKQRARETYKTRDDARAKKNNRTRKNPIIVTGEIAISKANLSRKDRKDARGRLKAEIFTYLAGIEMVNWSGIDYAYWLSKWDSFSWSRRESIFMSELLPYIINRKSFPSEKKIPDSKIVNPTKEMIRDARMFLESRNPSPTLEQTDYPDIDMSDPDMVLLAAARDRIKNIG